MRVWCLRFRARQFIGARACSCLGLGSGSGRPDRPGCVCTCAAWTLYGATLELDVGLDFCFVALHHICGVPRDMDMHVRATITYLRAGCNVSGNETDRATITVPFTREALFLTARLYLEGGGNCL